MEKNRIKEYRIWKAMKARCYAPSQKGRGLYQTFGIEVCDRWKNNYEAFASDMGPMPGPDYSIDRIDPRGNYEPSNCRWVPLSEQSKNRTNCLMFTYNGKTKCLKEWSRILGVKYDTLRAFVIRRKMGTFEDAIRYYGCETKEEY